MDADQLDQGADDKDKQDHHDRIRSEACLPQMRRFGKYDARGTDVHSGYRG